MKPWHDLRWTSLLRRISSGYTSQSDADRLEGLLREVRYTLSLHRVAFPSPEDPISAQIERIDAVLDGRG